MKISNLFLLLLLLSFNSTTHATNNKCQQLFQPFLVLTKNYRQAIKAIKASDLKTLQELIENNKINPQWKHPFNKSTFLHLAARHSHNQKVTDALIQAGVKIDALDSNKNTALHLAIASQNILATEALFKAGASLTIQDKDGNAALHISIASQNTLAMEALIKADVPLNIKNKKGNAALHVAAYFQNILAMEALIKAGAFIDIKNNYGDTALLIAVYFQNIFTTQVLIKAGASLNAQNKKRDTALHIAARDKSLDLMRLLMQDRKFFPIVKNNKGETVLDIAIKTGLEAEFPSHIKNNPLKNQNKRITKSYRQAIKAIRASDLQTLKRLIENNEIYIHQRTLFSKSTLLHLAARYSKDPGIIKALVEAGADLRAQDSRGNSALHLAIKNLNLSAVKEIINQADKRDDVTELLTILNHNRQSIYYSYTNSLFHFRHSAYFDSDSFFTPKFSEEEAKILLKIRSIIESTKSEARKIEEAVEASDLETVKRLIKRKKIDPNQIKYIEHHFTLLHLAARHSKDSRVIEALIKAGTDINTKDLEGDTALHIAARFNNEPATRALIEGGGDLTIQNNWGETALHIAANKNFRDIAKVLIETKNKNILIIKNNQGDTALFIAVRGNFRSLAKDLTEDTPLSVQDKQGNTVLHLAIKENFRDIVKDLIEANAPLAIKDTQGKTPLDLLKESKTMLDLYEKALTKGDLK